MNINDFVASFKTYPVLFIGTGMSLRYFDNSYTWDGLLSKICNEYNSNPEYYLDLKSKCTDSNNLCNYPKLGSLLEADFNEYAEKNRNGKFKEVNDIFYENMAKEKKLSRFKIYISSLFKDMHFRKEKEKELSVFTKVRKNVGSVITTNYDNLIEKVFEFTPLIGNNILLSNPYGSVYKIHGSYDHPEDIIITKKDYDRFDSKYELIRAQLLSLFINNPIIFLGYSIQDENIKSLLKTIFTYVNPNTELAKKIRKNFLLVEYSKGSTNLDISEHDIDINEIPGTIRINKISTDNYIAIYNALSDLVLPVSALDIRKVQNVVKDIYSGGSIKVVIASYDEMENGDRVLAIGTDNTISYNFMNTNEMIQNYFRLIKEENSAMITLLNKQKISSNQYFPVFGFSTVCKKINDIEKLKSSEVHNIKNYISRTQLRSNNHKSIEDILKDDSISSSYKDEAVFYAVRNHQISLENTERYLKQLCASRDILKSSNRRLLCLFDILMYSPESLP